MNEENRFKSAIEIFKIASGGDYFLNGRNVDTIEVDCFAGGVNIDFNGALVPDKRILLDITLVAGGMNIVIPSDWVVIYDLKLTIGGIDDIRVGSDRSSQNRANVKLVIRGTMMAGGITIAN